MREKADLMRETRQRRADACLVRREVWIHKSRTRKELDTAVRKLLVPSITDKPPKT